MRTDHFTSFDGETIAVHRLGSGRPVLMLHGFIASAKLNWIEPGIAQAVADAGFEVIAPDLRGHGESAAPEDVGAWPGDVLAKDQEALVAELGLTDFDLVGYSLGARTAVRCLVRGMRPRRCVLGGMGDSGVMQAGARAAMFEDSIRNGENAKDPRAGRYIQARIKAGGFNPQALLGVLSSFVPTKAQDLAGLDVPTFIVCGQDDADNGSPELLALAMPNAKAVRVPGDHLTAVAEPRLAAEMVAFLAA
ncbi:alpha/beta fold hydrolase [Caulobacter sp. SLTY]|uniref:alpha/beta fold hydrolase n=1 Tax=Caulobacter sp. SLTY TaxID=2683262 RepID=UPI001412102A|nr:alpha/beta fold hydrolase [Caulobacter sp. SLTY]NBB14190.1 alpha/beta fold hydrolase [Caulobacter sp. SLTY]